MNGVTLSDARSKLSGKQDRRVRRTRGALVEAFSRLVLNRHRNIRVGDVIEEAKVGRSTFYDHYSNADALLLDALQRPFGPLADAATGAGDEAKLMFILQHFWDYRQRARQTLNGRTEKLLSDMVAERLADRPLLVPTRIVARQLAASAHSAVCAWLAAEAPCKPDALARAICRAGEAQVQALCI